MQADECDVARRNDGADGIVAGVGAAAAAGDAAYAS